MQKQLVTLVDQGARLREQAHDSWNRIREDIAVSAQDQLAKDPFALEIIDSETKVEIASICDPVCMTVSFDPKTLRLNIDGCHRPIVLNFIATGENLPELERMGGVPSPVSVSVPALIRFIIQTVISQPVKYEASS